MGECDCDCGFQAYGEAEVEFLYGDSIEGTASFSATALGETYAIAIENMYAALNTLEENYFMENPSYQQIGVDYININCWPAGPPGLTLYYKVIVENGISINWVDLYPPFNSTFFNSTTKMSDANYVDNENIINFQGYKTPESIILNLPPTFGETVTILVPSDGSQVNANALYIDYGLNYISTVPFALYNINSSSGIFAGYTVMKINFDNSNPDIYTRTLEFY